MAPGSPPTPPHTPQSPPRQNVSGNLSQASQTSNAASPSIGHPLQALANSPLSQILVQNPALAQLLQQNPAILAQNPQLAQLLQQNLQAHMGSVLLQNARRDDSDDSRVSFFSISILFFYYFQIDFSIRSIDPIFFGFIFPPSLLPRHLEIITNPLFTMIFVVKARNFKLVMENVGILYFKLIHHGGHVGSLTQRE